MSKPAFKLEDENPDNQSNQQLCLSLIHAESEQEVIEILKKNGYWDSPENWRDFGDFENNASTIGAQSAQADYALVEKIINSIDANLISECKKMGIDPEGKGGDTPQSINEAVEKFYGKKAANLINLTRKELSDLSEKIKLIATGSKRNPCFIIADEGEGQSPEEMPHTLLSLNKSNKIKTPFVQGKFNTGGSGVLRFCGQESFQLILSKKNPEIKSGASSKQWGFTIVRKEHPKDIKNPAYRYLIRPDNKILSFDAEELPILPGKKYPVAYERSMRYGTFIKLYEYQDLPSSIIVARLYYRLSLLIPKIALPVHIYERRKGFESSDSHTNILSGLRVRLAKDRGEEQKILECPPFSIDLPEIIGQIIKCKVYVFKKGKIDSYSLGEGILFTLDGKTHGSLPSSFFRRKGVQLDYIADSLLVDLDCNNLDHKERYNLFMASRDRLNNSSPLKKEIEGTLKTYLKDHQGLKDLNAKRRGELIKDKLSDDKPVKDILEKIIRNSPSLSHRFGKGQRLSDPLQRHKNKEDESKLELKEFPDFFELKRKFDSDKPKKAYLQSDGNSASKEFSIEFKTNAENDYFGRDKDPAKYWLEIDGETHEKNTLNLWNGTATLKVKASKSWIPGKKLEIKSSISDIDRPTPFEETFFVQFVQKDNQSKKKKREPQKNNSGLAIPKIKLVKKNEWEDYGFNSYSALEIKSNPEGGHDFYINIDNIHLLNEMKNSRKDPKILKGQYKYGMMLFGLSLLHDKKSSEEENYKPEEISELAQHFSLFLLPIISLYDMDLD